MVFADTSRCVKINPRKWLYFNVYRAPDTDTEVGGKTNPPPSPWRGAERVPRSAGLHRGNRVTPEPLTRHRGTAAPHHRDAFGLSCGALFWRFMRRHNAPSQAGRFPGGGHQPHHQHPYRNRGTSGTPELDLKCRVHLPGVLASPSSAGQSAEIGPESLFHER